MNRLKWFSLLCGSVIADFQGIYTILVDPSIKVHGFSHTLLGSILYNSLFTLAVWVIMNIILSLKSCRAESSFLKKLEEKDAYHLNRIYNILNAEI